MSEDPSAAPTAMESPDAWQIGDQVWALGDAAPLHTSILFVDLVSSTDLASVMGIEEYAQFSRTFRSACQRQCDYFFSEYWARKYLADGRDYAYRLVGDELVVYLHTQKPHDDVYQLTCLAIALKCAWLGVDLNARRVISGRPTFELAAGIHSGPVWAERTPDGFDRSGFAINLAKRTEAVSREGDRFRIFLTDPAFKLVNRKMRNLLFGPRRAVEMKGVSPTIAVHELVESFVDPTRRLAPEFSASFAKVAELALRTNTFDMWIHSCIQTARGENTDSVSEDSMRLCRDVLNFDPSNAVALYFSAERESQRGDLETARLYLEDLTRHWPGFGDGWLELGRILEKLGDVDAARRCILQARRNGVRESEHPLPQRHDW